MTAHPRTSIAGWRLKLVLQSARICIQPSSTFCSLRGRCRSIPSPGFFRKPDNSQQPVLIDLPLSEEAISFYKTGRPFLQEYLPFWIATLVERMLLVFIPLAAVLYPLFTFLPKIYDWIIRSKIMGLYEEMKLIESNMEAQGHGYDADDVTAKLDQLDQRANALRLPRVYAIMLYTLRSHIDLSTRSVWQEFRLKVALIGETFLQYMPDLSTESDVDVVLSLVAFDPALTDRR